MNCIYLKNINSVESITWKLKVMVYRLLWLKCFHFNAQHKIFSPSFTDRRRMCQPMKWSRSDTTVSTTRHIINDACRSQSVSNNFNPPDSHSGNTNSRCRNARRNVLVRLEVYTGTHNEQVYSTSDFFDGWLDDWKTGPLSYLNNSSGRQESFDAKTKHV